VRNWTQLYYHICATGALPGHGRNRSSGCYVCVFRVEALEAAFYLRFVGSLALFVSVFVVRLRCILTISVYDMILALP